MEVLKVGKKKGAFEINVECKQKVDEFGLVYGKEVDYCDSVLKVNENDIVKHEWSEYPDYKGTDYGVVCPICGSFITIDKKLIPTRVLENAQSIRLEK